MAKLPTADELKEHTYADLAHLREEVETAMQAVEKRAKAETRMRMEQMAKEAGFSLDELLAKPRTGRSKPNREPRYVHPDDPTVTWSGLGRWPQWLIDLVEEGHEKEDFLISKQMQSEGSTKADAPVKPPKGSKAKAKAEAEGDEPDAANG